MARTTYTLVKQVMQTGLTNDEIDEIIEFATRIITRQLDGEGLTADQLTDIETYIAAHLIAIGKERQTYTEKIGDIMLIFQKNPKGFFEQTTYGQMALFLDSSGKLQASAMKRATFRAIYQSESSD
jgi:hypothetical protein